MTTQPPLYDPNIPENFFDSLAISQDQLQNNFFQIFNIFSKNHVEINDSTAPGAHSLIEILEQENAPFTDQSEISVYSKNVDGQTDQLFIKYQNGTEIQVTNYQIYSIKAEDAQIYYFTFLPGKVLLYFGKKISTSGANPSKIKLKPYVAKNIISACVIPEFNNASSPAKYSAKPDLSLIKNTDGIITQIGILYPAIQTTSNNSFYFIMANI